MSIPISEPDPRELLIVRGWHKGNAFVCIGIIREQEGKRSFVSSMGETIPWSQVSRWDYLHDVAPAYDIWADTTTRYYRKDKYELVKNREARAVS